MPGGSSNSVRIFWPELDREELIRRIREAPSQDVGLVQLLGHIYQLLTGPEGFWQPLEQTSHRMA